MTGGMTERLFLCPPAVSFLGSFPKELEVLRLEAFLKAMDGNKDHYKQSSLIFLWDGSD